MRDVTEVLAACAAREPRAAEELLPLVYDELRRLAQARLAREVPGQTLQATALVHEAWVRLLGPEGAQKAWANRAHFFSASAEAMRRILIDRARRKARPKHGGEFRRVQWEDLDVAETAEAEVLLAVNDSLTRLAAEDPQAAELVNLRFFVGLEMSEIAAALGQSERSVYRIWAFARAWLYDDLQREFATAPPSTDAPEPEP